MSVLHFSLKHNIFITMIGHPLSTDPKSLKSQQGSDVLSSETETQHPPTGHSYTPLLQQSTHTMGTFFEWKGRQGWVVVSGGMNGWGWGWEQDRGMTVLLWVSVFLFCSRAGGHRWGTEQMPVCPTLWMQIMLHCTRLPQSSEGAGHLFCGYYECWGLFSGRAEHGCFPLFLHTGAERWAFILVIWKPWD